MAQVASCKPYRIAFNLAASGLALTGTRGILLDVNRAFCEILGYRHSSELVGRSFRDVIHPDDGAEAATALDELLKGKGERYQAERRYRRRDGSDIWVLASVALVRDPRGRPWYFISQVQDLTERRERDELTRRAALIKDHHDTARTFAAEVLTPLRGLRDQLARGELDQVAATVEQIVTNAERLHRELLDEERVSTTPE